jgi:hypothetical protein
MIYSDVEQDDQLNKCTSSDSFISTFTTESSDITTHTDLLDRIQQLHHKFAFVRVGNDLLLDPTSNQTHMNETMRSSISPSSLSSVSPEEVQPGFFSSSRLSFVRKLIKKLNILVLPLPATMKYHRLHGGHLFLPVIGNESKNHIQLWKQNYLNQWKRLYLQEIWMRLKLMKKREKE